ncbi:MAG: 2-C-methyl-D-erythritol 4-phosphate cytidylyltransferase, partial [Chlamydiia bacterium]|nr:2-C-methyl-D-erythritol 4-phosphate cytidylyltransferase [Chlamydiia bacterium]
LAGGQGARFNDPLPKVFHPLKGKAIIRHSFDLFISMKEIDEIVVVCPQKYHTYFPEKTLFASPGNERQDSVKNGLAKTTGEIILIHDGARPFITSEDVKKLLNEGLLLGAAALGAPVKNTIKQVHKTSLVEKTLDRTALFEMFTPQLLRRSLLEKGLQAAKDQKLTDDVALAELLNHPVKIVEGSRRNIKITYPLDLEIAHIL